MNNQIGTLDPMDEAGVFVTLQIPFANWGYFVRLAYALQQIESKTGIPTIGTNDALVAQLLSVPKLLARRMMYAAVTLGDELEWDIRYDGEICRVVSTFYKCQAQIRLI